MRGIASAMAVAMPVFQPPLRTCAPEQAPLGTERREACITAVQFMVDHFAEQISRAVGALILEKAEAQDREAARRKYDDLWQPYVALFGPVQSDETVYQQFATDWCEIRSETAAIERSLSRSGLTMAPPADWKAVTTQGSTFIGGDLVEDVIQ